MNRSGEVASVLEDMELIFTLYSKNEFTNTRNVWLKSVCHYICKGFVAAVDEIFNVLAMVSVGTLSIDWGINILAVTFHILYI